MSWKQVVAQLSCALVFLFFIGCNRADKAHSTSLSFNVEGTRYELQNASLTAMKLNDNNLHFFDLGLDPSTTNIITTVPSARIQFKMEIENIAELEGRRVELHSGDYKTTGAIFQFMLAKDLTASSLKGATLILTFDHVEDDFVSGHFEGSNLSLVSMKEDVFRKVDVTGDFRARILR